MNTRLILACSAAMMIANTALAGQNYVVPTQLGVAGLERFGTAAGNFSPIIKQAGYYCRRDCRWCRNDCYAQYRVYCYAPGCRRSFVLCMRACWYNICRGC